jgi:D-tyrosyl-tRNA(Tyr) deacylase
MRAVIQRVSRASVTVDGEVVGSIGRGLLVLLGVGRGDDEAAGRWIADKLLKLRVFEDAEGRMNRTVSDVGGELLVVSQFTLYGDITKGNRPGFDAAAPPEIAGPLYEKTVGYLREVSPVPVATGRFRATMEVSLVNDGPVTFLLDRQESGAFP